MPRYVIFLRQQIILHFKSNYIHNKYIKLYLKFLEWSRSDDFKIKRLPSLSEDYMKRNQHNTELPNTNILKLSGTTKRKHL